MTAGIIDTPPSTVISTMTMMKENQMALVKYIHPANKNAAFDDDQDRCLDMAELGEHDHDHDQHTENDLDNSSELDSEEEELDTILYSSTPISRHRNRKNQNESESRSVNGRSCLSLTSSSSPSSPLKRKKSSVRFSVDLITEVHERPRTLPSQKADLFYSSFEIQRFRSEYKQFKRALRQQEKQSQSQQHQQLYPFATKYATSTTLSDVVKAATNLFLLTVHDVTSKTISTATSATTSSSSCASSPSWKTGTNKIVPFSGNSHSGNINSGFNVKHHPSSSTFSTTLSPGVETGVLVDTLYLF